MNNYDNSDRPPECFQTRSPEVEEALSRAAWKSAEDREKITKEEIESQMSRIYTDLARDAYAQAALEREAFNRLSHMRYTG